MLNLFPYASSEYPIYKHDAVPPFLSLDGLRADRYPEKLMQEISNALNSSSG